MKKTEKTTAETGVNTGAVNIGDGAAALAQHANGRNAAQAEKRGNSVAGGGNSVGGGAKRKEKMRLAAAYLALTLLSTLWLLPIAYLLYTAFRVQPDTGIINRLFPEKGAMQLPRKEQMGILAVQLVLGEFAQRDMCQRVRRERIHAFRNVG